MKSDPSRLRNFNFVTGEIEKLDIPHIVSQQISAESDRPRIWTSTNIYVKSDSTEIEKSKLINIAANHARTDFLWVHDCDIMLNFKSALEKFYKIENAQAIKPYKYLIRLTNDQTIDFLQNKRIDREQQSKAYPMIFGAASFIIKKSTFLEINGMDVRYRGWGYEDFDLERRVVKKCKIIELNGAAIHLYHQKANLNKMNEKLFQNGESISPI